MAHQLLIVEDNPDIARLVQLHARDIDCEADIARDGREALNLYQRKDYQLVILDLMLPEIDGLEVCRQMRTHSGYVPILILTSRSSELDRVLGLEVGADDYVTKPFSIPELLARIKAQFRRSQALARTPAPTADIIVHSGLAIDGGKRKVTVKDHPVALTAREFDLLSHFASHPGQVFSRVQLLQQVWGCQYEGYEHTVNTHINRLRAKIEADPASPDYILTVWGVGYRFNDALGMIPRTLFAKLALSLTLVLLGVGLFYAVLNTWLSRHYQQEFLQNLNHDLAASLVSERRLVQDGVLNQAALKETFHHYMVVNPSIEIYLLDDRGSILSYSAEPGKVKRGHVDLGPVRAFIRGDPLPLLGDDPRHLQRSKVFSATPLPSEQGATGYLYVVLRGEEYARIEKLFRNSLLVRLSGTSTMISLLLALALGLLLFRLLTRRLNTLARQMQCFSDDNFTRPCPYPEDPRKDDEIELLGRHYNRMAERIHHQLSDLKRQDVIRRELITNVSHDLRTPLAALQGYIETLHLKADEFDAGTRTQYLHTALRHSRRLSRLVEELFELSRLDARETEVRPEGFSAAELVQDVLQKFQLPAQQRRIRLHMECSGNIPFVNGDIALVERVLENLIGNALRHTPDQGEVVVGLQAQEREVDIQVRDNGSGIDAKDLPHIFKRLYRGGNRERGGAHAGLGLAIAQHIVALHQAEINVSSEPGKGSCFSFPLPRFPAIKAENTAGC